LNNLLKKKSQKVSIFTKKTPSWFVISIDILIILTYYNYLYHTIRQAWRYFNDLLRNNFLINNNGYWPWTSVQETYNIQ
jgi:hypothetical protein